jgi:hypothetical protein
MKIAKPKMEIPSYKFYKIQVVKPKLKMTISNIIYHLQFCSKDSRHFEMSTPKMKNPLENVGILLSIFVKMCLKVFACYDVHNLFENWNYI